MTSSKPISDSAAFVPQLREIGSYVRSLRGSFAVVLIPGELSLTPHYQSIINDLILLSHLGVRIAIVFGSRPQINAAIDGPGVFHNNIRVTRQEDMARIVELCASERLRHQKAFRVHSGGHSAASVVWGNWVSARPLGVIDGVNMGRSGAVRRIHTQAISNLLEHEHIALFDVIALSPIGEAYNLMAEELAVELAIQLGADKLLIYSDLNSLKISLPARLTIHDARSIAQTHTQLGHTTLHPALDARQRGVKRVYLLDIHHSGAILQELLTINGAGILLSDDDYESIGPAYEQDIGALLSLFEPLINDGTLLPRDRLQLETSLSNFRVLRRDSVPIGCYSLQPLDDNLYELGCLVISPQFRGAQLGRRLIKEALDQAGSAQVVTFTTRASDWFLENGFSFFKPDHMPDNPALAARLAANHKNNRHADCFISHPHSASH